jgi:hypothetical protein
MLEVLLWQYEQQFGEEFPLKDFEGEIEIDVINLVYDCLLHNTPYRKGQPRKEIPNRFPTAPGLNKQQ